MLRLLSFVALSVVSVVALGQGAAGTAAPAADPLAPLGFLLGTWNAASGTVGSSGSQAIGTYTFSRDLGGHALQRTGTVAACKGPQDFDCNHRDQLTVFPDTNAQAVHHSSLLALYLGNEGHVIYYTITLPDPHTAVFDSQGPATAPRFKLVYHLEGGVMSGKFQFAPPGSTEYRSYLEWSGAKL